MPITINGSGTIGGLSAGGLPDGSIQQADLAAGVAGNGPAFSAVLNSSQTLTVNTWTKLQLNYKLFDTANCFDATTNFRFTPNVAGYYSFFGLTNGAAITAYISIYKNGNQLMQSATPSGCPSIQFLTYMNGTTDYVELYMYSSSGQTVSNSQPNIYTSLSGSLVRAA